MRGRSGIGSDYEQKTLYEIFSKNYNNIILCVFEWMNNE